MNQDEIIEMAKEAGFWQDLSVYEGLGEHFKAFAKLVEDAAFKRWAAQTKLAVQDEREACAVVAEEWFCGCGRGNCPEGDRRAHDIADSIRARGEA